jgi:hypothetical protein
MKGITLEEGQIILQDIHVGVYGTHTGAKPLLGKAYMHGFFWLTAVSDADSIVRRCEGASFLIARSMYHLISCRPYPLPGLFHIGARFGRSVQESKGWIHTHLRRSGQIHKMGRSEASCLHHSGESS